MMVMTGSGVSPGRQTALSRAIFCFQNNSVKFIPSS